MNAITPLQNNQSYSKIKFYHINAPTYLREYMAIRDKISNRSNTKFQSMVELGQIYL